MAMPVESLAPQLISGVATQPPRRRSVGGPRLSVVIVNYRQWGPTGALVRQLLASPGLQTGKAEVVIVDNHSPRHPLLSKLRRTPHVSVRRWKKNHGFARAVNEGCRLAQGDWFLLLNPDITLSDDFLDRVLDLTDRLTGNDPKAGIIGFHLRNGDGTQQLSTGPVPTLPTTLSRLALPRRFRKYQTQATDEPREVPWVTGCCLLVRRDCLAEVAGLDEQFFLYYEDVDLCVRAKEKGWSIWYDPTLTVIHHQPLHARPQPAALRLVTRHSLLTFARKHWPAWQVRLLARIIGMEGKVRTWLSHFRGDIKDAHLFQTLTELANDFLTDQPGVARMRLEQFVHRLDLRVGV